jgi:hypothetical protein
METDNGLPYARVWYGAGRGTLNDRNGEADQAGRNAACGIKAHHDDGARHGHARNEQGRCDVAFATNRFQLFVD